MTNRVLVLRKLALLRGRVAEARARRPSSAQLLRSNDLLLDALALARKRMRPQGAATRKRPQAAPSVAVT